MTLQTNDSSPEVILQRIDAIISELQALKRQVSTIQPDEPESLVVPPAEEDTQVEQEKRAYLQLYPQLKKQYAGQYVAIHNSQLVDHDVDYGALFERIDDRYPDTFVWLTQVEAEPIGTIVVRSPRFVRE
jgi:hypothetical protein